MSKDKGFFRKYKVKKLSNPTKEMHGIFLEFDDPIARKGIRAWAKTMAANGYSKCANQVILECNKFDQAQGEWT